MDSVASSIRDAFTSSSWIPLRAKPAPPPPSVLRAHAGYLESIGDWISRHRAVTAAVVAFLGTGSFMVYHSRLNHRRKRRAKRAGNGARKEIVVLAGPPGSMVTKSLMLDLERRGFIVYCVVHTEEEERIVQGESETKTDIRPFHLNLSNVSCPSPTRPCPLHGTLHMD